MIAKTRISEECLGFLGMSAKSESRLFFAPVPQHACAVSDYLAVRVSCNNNLQNVKITDLQQALNLLCDGIRVIGEGTTFDAGITNSILKTNCWSIKLNFLGDPFR